MTARTAYEDQAFLVLQLEDSNSGVGHSIHHYLQDLRRSDFVFVFFGVSELSHVPGAASQERQGVQISGKDNLHGDRDLVVWMLVTGVEGLPLLQPTTCPGLEKG